MNPANSVFNIIINSQHTLALLKRSFIFISMRPILIRTAAIFSVVFIVKTLNKYLVISSTIIAFTTLTIQLFLRYWEVTTYKLRVD